MKLGQAARVVRGENWYISRYNDYLYHRDKEAERDHIQDIMTRPPRIRAWSWSASAAGTCPRKRQFDYLGMPRLRPTEKGMNIFANGDYMHIRHQAFGLVAGYVDGIEVPVALPQYNLLGTMDGTLVNGNGLELKSINTRGFSEVMSFGPKPDHVMQMHSYMLASGLEAFHVVYEDKDKQHLKEILVRRDEKIINAVREELETLNEATNERRLLPMLQECINEKGAYNWCDYRAVCEGASWPASRSVQLTLATSSSVAG